MPPTVKLRRLLRRTPEWLHPTLRHAAMNPYANRALRRPHWGNLRRDRPFSRLAGADRGTPIDRYYVEHFVAQHCAQIRGDVLEVGDDHYTRTFGNGVRAVEVIDIAHHNLEATLLADLAEAGSLEPAAYDCAIVTQTLQHVPDAAGALANVWQSLRPGGGLLLSVPCLGRREPGDQRTESWRFLEPGVRHLISQACTPAPETLTVAAYGNLRSALAVLLGLAAEELSPAELDATDDDYPVVIALAATKPATGP